MCQKHLSDILWRLSIFYFICPNRKMPIKRTKYCVRYRYRTVPYCIVPYWSGLCVTEELLYRYVKQIGYRGHKTASNVCTTQILIHIIGGLANWRTEHFTKKQNERKKIWSEELRFKHTAHFFLNTPQPHNPYFFHVQLIIPVYGTCTDNRNLLFGLCRGRGVKKIKCSNFF